MKKVMKMILLILGGLLLLLVIAGAVYAYRNVNFDQGVMKKLERAGFAEKQAELPDGTILNYGEGPDNGPALFLIHGQMTTWVDYAKVLPELSQHFHIFAVDCHGHGGSSKDPARYTAQAMGEDFVWFIEQVIGEPAFVSGHSSGGLLAAWLAADSPQNVRGVVLEDPPFFSTEPDRWEKTFSWVDGFEPIHRFLNQSEEPNYTRFYLKNSYLGTLIGKPWQDMIRYADSYLDKHPGKPLRVFFLPASVNRNFDLLSGPYDLRFGDTFYDGRWFENFDQAETLARISVPSVLIHTSWSYSADGILLAAMSGEDAQRAHALIAGNELISVKSGHDFHYEKPQEFIRILLDFLQAHPEDNQAPEF